MDSVTAFVGVGILVPQIRSCSRNSIPPFSFHIHSSHSVQWLVWTSYSIMAGKKGAGENSKKAAGNARVCFFLKTPPPLLLPHPSSIRSFEQKLTALYRKRTPRHRRRQLRTRRRLRRKKSNGLRDPRAMLRSKSSSQRKHIPEY